MTRPPPLADAIPAAGLLPRTTAWLLDALLLLPVTVALGMLWPQPAHRLAQHWQQLAEATAAQMAAALARGSDAGGLLLAMLAAGSPVRSAISALVQACLIAFAVYGLIFAVLALLYWPLQEASARRATLGKRALGLQVTDANGARLAPARALLRHLAGTASWLTLNFGHMLAGQAPRHQALHDRIAGSRVRWQDGQPRRLPWWGALLLLAALLLPLLLALLAGLGFSANLENALGV